MIQLRYRVVIGYGSGDYISITENELEKAKVCMVTEKVFTHKGKYVRGSEIKRIEPDIRYYTHWNDTYSPSSQEDTVQIARDVPMRELEARSEQADMRVEAIIKNNRYDLLENPEKVDILLLK